MEAVLTLQTAANDKQSLNFQMNFMTIFSKTSKEK